MANEIVKLPLSKLKPNPDNVKIFNMAKIDALAQSIKKDGFIGAIEVIKVDKDTYEILSGHRRYEAMKLLGNKEIPAIVHEDIDEITKSRTLLSANINNRELTAMDKARAINYYIEHVSKPSGSTNTLDDAAEFFSISKSSVKNYRKLTKFSKKLQAVLEEDLISYTGLVDDVTSFDAKTQDKLADDIRKAVSENDGEDLGFKRVRQLVHNISLEIAREENRAKSLEDKKLDREEEEAQKEFVEIKAQEAKEEEKKPVNSIGTSLFEEFGGMAAYGFEQGSSIDNETEYADEKINEAVDLLKIALRREVKGDISSQLKQLRQMIDKLEKK